jgi:hypothetical protein
MLFMETVVDLLQWRRAREIEPANGLLRLEAAIRRLDEVATSTLDARGQLDPWVETELLAIMGSLSIDLFEEAAGRAERLADRLTHGRTFRKEASNAPSVTPVPS